MFSITIDTAALRRQLEACSHELEDTRGVLTDVGTYLTSEIQIDFEALSRGGAAPSDGRKWAPLAESTEKTKARKGGWNGKGSPPKSQVGVDTGLLRNSATPGFKGDGDGGNIFDVDAQKGTVTVGYGRSYAAAFHSRRPLLPEQFPDAWGEGVVEVVNAWFMQALTGDN